MSKETITSKESSWRHGKLIECNDNNVMCSGFKSDAILFEISGVTCLQMIIFTKLIKD